MAQLIHQLANYDGGVEPNIDQEGGEDDNKKKKKVSTIYVNALVPSGGEDSGPIVCVCVLQVVITGPVFVMPLVLDRSPDGFRAFDVHNVWSEAGRLSFDSIGPG